jgi:hypothetical protein
MDVVEEASLPAYASLVLLEGPRPDQCKTASICLEVFCNAAMERLGSW